MKIIAISLVESFGQRRARLHNDLGHYRTLWWWCIEPTPGRLSSESKEIKIRIHQHPKQDFKIWTD